MNTAPYTTAWHLKILSPEEFTSLGEASLSEEQLLYIAHFGLLAPTSHNTVPQRFKMNPNENAIEIWLDRKFVLAYSDVVGRQALVSIGCVLENMKIAAQCYGYISQINLIASDEKMCLPFVDTEPQYTHIATIHFTLNKARKPFNHALLESMLCRKVVRAEYDESIEMPAHLHKELAERILNEYPLVHLHMIHNKIQLHALAKFQEIADRTVFEQDTFAYELGEWLLPNEDTTSLVGMRGKEFGFDDDFARRVHNGLLRKERLFPDEIAAFALGGKIGIKSSSAVAVLTVEHDTIEERIAAGQAYEACALLLEQHGFVTAMHAGITEVKIVSRMFSASLGTKRKPVVVCRIGKPLKAEDLLREHSARPQLKDIILT